MKKQHFYSEKDDAEFEIIFDVLSEFGQKHDFSPFLREVKNRFFRKFQIFL
jgi:hypothetical protein